ncbi:MAG: PIN domain-containing protein [Myxococcales bacterium]|nr:PIN domain-containing protein [Myxococcales bacterium]
MKVHLDACILIDRVEGATLCQQAAEAALTSPGLGDTTCISDLVRFECMVKPVRLGDATLRAAYETEFGFHETLAIPSGVFDLAAELRGVHRLKTPDALHAACAIYRQVRVGQQIGLSHAHPQVGRDLGGLHRRWHRRRGRHCRRRGRSFQLGGERRDPRLDLHLVGRAGRQRRRRRNADSAKSTTVLLLAHSQHLVAQLRRIVVIPSRSTSRSNARLRMCRKARPSKTSLEAGAKHLHAK